VTGLGQPTAGRPARRAVTLAVTSGKGGVGKTNVVVNLAVSLARLHNRVAILDADFGLGNVDVLLGLTPPHNLGHLLNGDLTIDDIAVEGPYGLRVVPASSGLRELTALSVRQWERLNEGLARLTGSLDFLIVDTGAGISNNVVDMLSGADRVMVVTSLEPTSVVDAYAMVKILTGCNPAQELGLLINGARDQAEADLVFRQLDIAATRFLHRRLQPYGHVPTDPAVREAVLLQQAVVTHAPHSPASQSFRRLATRVSAMAPLGGPGLRLVPPAGSLSAPLSGMGAPQCA
jgi:flagellar biosynthesis protein FlhG